MRRARIDRWLAAAVLGHLAVTFAHGAAHGGADVPLSGMQTAFVLLIIEVAPIAGLALSLARPRAGASIVGASMAASLLFGLVNHFVIISPDHVTAVAASWRPLFTATAVLLVASEAIGVIVALRSVRRPLENLS